MEDYVEMIYRSKKNEIRITELSTLLNVKASSVSKMASKLKELKIIEYEKYSVIKLTENGKKLGKYLLKRHNILLNLFKIINKEENYYLIEQIEHFFDENTISNIEIFLKTRRNK